MIAKMSLRLLLALPHQQRRFWVEPAENEAPFATNSNPAVVTSDVNDDDDEEPRSFSKENDRVGVSAASSDEASEELDSMPFLVALRKRGFEMIVQEGDGNCLFRAVSLQVYGSSDNHAEVRERCMDYMAQNEEHFSDFIAFSSNDEMVVPPGKNVSAFQIYIARKRISGVHGNHTEIQALSELFNRPVEVYTPESCYGENVKLQPINIFHEEYKTSDPPIRLSYHDGNHYNAIIDPLIPTAGLGLGLPGLKVGLADKMQITKAITESDQLADELELERVIKESKDEIHNQTEEELQKVLTESSRDFVSFHWYAPSVRPLFLLFLIYLFLHFNSDR
jgi:OTU domain-containing protein 5